VSPALPRLLGCNFMPHFSHNALKCPPLVATLPPYHA
jgi:hypothetical protein